ncbi:MAG: helix-turn-helix transcriptional regulator [Oribacterium sp.]|nr:helix-turn-helix transcriptional regulator [Oribacterium sp.]
MTLGEIIKEYREANKLSQREFAKLAGLSNSYISQLEMNTNSKNGLPIKPQIETIKAVADAMNTTIDVLFAQMDDIVIDISKKPAADEGSELDHKIMRLVYQLPDDLKESLYDLLQAAVLGVGRR